MVRIRNSGQGLFHLDTWDFARLGYAPSIHFGIFSVEVRSVYVELSLWELSRASKKFSLRRNSLRLGHLDVHRSRVCGWQENHLRY